jgi:two-component system, chemotaxis family, sensor kinase Cph1
LPSLQAGCNEHIGKPFTETAIFEVIARFLGVRYRYGAAVSSRPFIPTHQALTPQNLQVMPVEWIAQVREAALDLRDERLLQLIGQIPKHEQWLSEALTSLVNNFQLEAIVALTQT